MKWSATRMAWAGLLLSAPTAVYAEICNKERPGWSPADGPATALDEFFHLATSLPGLGILGAFTLALLTGRKLYFAIAALFSGMVALGLWHEAHVDPTGLHALGRSEGCVGDLTFTIWTLGALTFIALGALAILRLRPPPA